MVDIELWRNSEKTIKKSQRYYAHFDYRTDITKCWEYISNPQQIAKHGFYPFIHYVKTMNKYTKHNELKRKERDICYAAHFDRCIYQYYNFLLSNFYNEKCKELSIDDVALAYRTNQTKQSNIQFAKRAIDFIRNSGDCYVMIGDFTKFFDNLNHKYLKTRWCRILNQSTLPADHYAVFKNITGYSYIELTDILQVHGLTDRAKDRKVLNSKKRAFSTEDLKKHKSLIHKNREIGIPQGSPMSGVLANIYMLDADKQLSDMVSSFGGLYMRYSDDFIIVVPFLDEQAAIRVLTDINSLFNSEKYPGLLLQPSKTQYYHYEQNRLENCGGKINNASDCSNQFLNFLGFTFDGKKVSIRAKTISKYYYRMRHKAKGITASKWYTKKGHHISSKNLYKKYSERGAYGKEGNFLTYVERAEREFGTDELIRKPTQLHMQKIRKALKKRL